MNLELLLGLCADDGISVWIDPDLIDTEKEESEDSNERNGN